MKPNRKHICLEDLRLRILSLDIAPGEDLDETVLSEAYGLSRTPLREVLQRLSGAGYVELFEHRSAKVASMDMRVMRSFFQTAPLIYATTARLAAANRTGAQLDQLKATQTAFMRAVAAEAANDMAMANHRFHEQIGEMAANAYLTPSLHRLLIDHTRLGQMFYRATTSAETAAILTAGAQHDAMIAAFEAGDTNGAVDLTRQHWDLSRDGMERFVRPDPLPLDPAEPSREAETTHAL